MSDKNVSMKSKVAYKVGYNKPTKNMEKYSPHYPLNEGPKVPHLVNLYPWICRLKGYRVYSVQTFDPLNLLLTKDFNVHP